jgi:hypothetical protein
MGVKLLDRYREIEDAIREKARLIWGAEITDDEIVDRFELVQRLNRPMFPYTAYYLKDKGLNMEVLLGVWQGV